VKNEKLVSVVEDVMANDYVAGEGVRFFSKDSFSSRWANQEIGRKEMSESLIAFSVDMTEDEIHELPDAVDRFSKVWTNWRVFLAWTRCAQCATPREICSSRA